MYLILFLIALVIIIFFIVGLLTGKYYGQQFCKMFADAIGSVGPFGVMKWILNRACELLSF